MRVRAHQRWQGGCNRVPAVNKSTLGAGFAVVKLVSGMESKRSTNTCTPRDRDIKNAQTHKMVRISHTQQPTEKGLQYCMCISLMKPMKKNKREETVTSRVLINMNKSTTA